MASPTHSEGRKPRVTRLGFYANLYAPRYQRGSGGDESNSEDDARSDAGSAQTITPTQRGGREGGARQLPQVMRLGTDSKFDADESRASAREFFTGSGGGEGSTGRERRCSLDEPTVLRLARNSNSYFPDESDSDEDTGGGDTPPPANRPAKRFKHRGDAEISSLSTSSSDIPFRVLPSTLQRVNSPHDNEELNDAHFLRTLSPIDRLHQIIREDQSLEDGSAIETYRCCSATPYFVQPDRWSCGYRNLQMLLGSLRVLQIDGESNSTMSPDPSPSKAAAEENEENAKVRSLPADLSERIMALAGIGEGFGQSTPNESDKGSSSGGYNSQVAMSLPQQEQGQGQERTRKDARSAGLRGGFKHQPNYEDGLLVPSVLELQMLVEQAWDAGYDAEGSVIFQPEGVRGNERWIGRPVLFFSLFGLFAHFFLLHQQAQLKLGPSFRASGYDAKLWISKERQSPQARQ